MTVSTGGATVVGFSLTNNEIAAGSGVLTVLAFSDVTAATSDLSLGNFGAITSASGTVYEVLASGSIDHGAPDCLGDYYGDAAIDECGVCDGDGIAEGACDCDGNVADCAGECGGSAVEDECGECGGDGAAEGFDCDGGCVDSDVCGFAELSFGAVTDMTAEILYTSNFDIGGFQFDTDGVELTGVESVLSGATFSGTTGIVIGFDMMGVTLPAGDGVLATLSFAPTNDAATLSASSVTVSTGAGNTLLSSGPASVQTDGCYVTDCADVCYGDGAEDECGVCNGDGIAEGACDCDGNIADCAGECGGSASEDDCGVCNGNNACSGATLSLGAFDASGLLEVLYDFGGPVAGFQFDVTGLDLTGASGGAAGDAGMTVSTGGATVVGFSLTNNEIAAGSGVLTVLAFSDVTAATSDLSLGNFGAITSASGTVYEVLASGSIDHGAPDCLGDYYGDAAIDECGVCDGDGIAEGACDCDGNVADCAGECGGSAVEDECGECGGDGAAEGFDCDGGCVDSDVCGFAELSFGAVTDMTAEILYTSNFDIGGFQFDTDGVELTGVESALSGATFSGATGIVLSLIHI